VPHTAHRPDQRRCSLSREPQTTPGEAAEGRWACSCLWRWDDSSLDLLAAASTALVALILTVTLVGAIATMRLG
jgi:hypothetical protein